MAPASAPSLYMSIGIAALVGWRIYSRVRRTISRQKLTRIRPWLTAGFFPALIAVLLVGSLNHPANLLSLAGGTAFGAALGFYGLRLTRFEQTPEGLFFTPNAPLGIALSLLFLGRIAYRFATFYLAEGSQRFSAAEFGRSPLTLLIFGTLAGYYVAYAIGLLRWRHRVTRGNLSS